MTPWHHCFSVRVEHIETMKHWHDPVPSQQSHDFGRHCRIKWVTSWFRFQDRKKNCGWPFFTIKSWTTLGLGHIQHTTPPKLFYAGNNEFIWTGPKLCQWTALERRQAFGTRSSTSYLARHWNDAAMVIFPKKWYHSLPGIWWGYHEILWDIMRCYELLWGYYDILMDIIGRSHR